MPPPAVALLLKTDCEGTTSAARGAALGQVVGQGRIANGQGADTVDAAALAGAVVGYAVPAGCTDGCVAVRVQHVTVRVAPTSLELLIAPPPALAPGLPPSAWLPVKVLLLIVAEPVLARLRSMPPPAAKM